MFKTKVAGPSLRWLLAMFLCASSLYSSAEKLTIAFGSCNEQDRDDLTIWQSINAKQPDLFVFLGDNVYIDSTDEAKFSADYQSLFANPEIKILQQNSDIMAVWDDHDYGLDDGGKEFSAKQIAKRAFIKAFDYKELHDIPEQQGIFHSRTLTLNNKTIRLIMLDSRWYRDKLLNNQLSESDRSQFELGPYRPHTDTSMTLLGEQQWQWLEETLAKPVDLNIFASSIQFISEYTAWEIWANFPHERRRMLQLLNKYSKGNAVFLSGDVHRGEFSSLQLDDWQLVDITTGPLNSAYYPGKINIHRMGEVFVETNFGMLDITTEDNKLLVKAGIYNKNGQLLEQHKISIAQTLNE